MNIICRIIRHLLFVISFDNLDKSLVELLKASLSAWLTCVCVVSIHGFQFQTETWAKINLLAVLNFGSGVGAGYCLFVRS